MPLRTSARAVLLQQQFPELVIVSGVTLNRAVGGLNPHAVERSAQIGGKMVWFPTLEARAYQKYHHKDGPYADRSQYLAVYDDDGELLPQATEVSEAAARNNMIVGTGHISALEGMALVCKAAELNCRMVLTHADNPADLYTIEQQKYAVELGAYIEHCFFTTYYNRVPIEQIAEQIKAVGCEYVILTTYFGQVKSPYSDEGMLQYAQLLKAQGFTDDELFQMMSGNPEKLLATYSNI